MSVTSLYCRRIRPGFVAWSYEDDDTREKDLDFYSPSAKSGTVGQICILRLTRGCHFYVLAGTRSRSVLNGMVQGHGSNARAVHPCADKGSQKI